ncbi:hypothetical protein [Telmatospirillum sp.]|uniref:hypothetical protein n=1 Tax=Telmatospirillum sp. TaxID=2079197 RepID=UPI00284C2856|nr:hypothetical protein [Telmatospirillum sp.]MDR3440173.1 hypothetical protein [Telmatospirillum sp.]
MMQSLVDRVRPCLRRPKRLLALTGCMLAVAALAACYIPDNFKSEIRLGATGDYAVSFWGDLVWAPLFRDIQEHKISQEEGLIRVAEIEKDLKRDSHFKSIESLGKGRFKVAYEREGHLEATDMVTFVRRNAIIIQITAKQDGTILVNANTMRPNQAQEATTIGLNVQGEFRIIADGQVKEHNASEVRPFGRHLIYIWTIKNAFSPSPHFVMQREGVWPAKPQEKK